MKKALSIHLLPFSTDWGEKQSEPNLKRLRWLKNSKALNVRPSWKKWFTSLRKFRPSEVLYTSADHSQECYSCSSLVYQYLLTETLVPTPSPSVSVLCGLKWNQILEIFQILYPYIWELNLRFIFATNLKDRKNVNSILFSRVCC